MKFNLRPNGQNQSELTIELAKNDLEKYVERAENQLGKDLQLDGFRKGKVPKDLLRKQVGGPQILEAALDLAMRESLAKTIESEGLDVLDASKLEIKENTPDKLIYTVVLTLFPDVKIADFSGLKVVKKEVSVGQEEIGQTLESIRASRAKLDDKNGPAQNGDRIEVDFEVKSDGKIIEGGSSKNHPLILGNNNFMPGFEENLVGMKQGEEKAFTLIAPEDYFNKEVAGKKLDFVVRVNSVKSVELPALTDELARSIGKFENIDQLAANVREGILEEKKMKEKQRLRLEILDNIIKVSDISIPKAMVDQQLDNMIKNLDEDLHGNDMELGLYLAHIGKTQDDLRKEWKAEAEKQVKTVLILHKIAKDKNINVSSEETEGALNDAVQSLMVRGDIDKANLDVDGLRNRIATQIINNKTLDFLERTCGV